MNQPAKPEAAISELILRYPDARVDFGHNSYLVFIVLVIKLGFLVVICLHSDANVYIVRLLVLLALIFGFSLSQICQKL